MRKDAGHFTYLCRKEDGVDLQYHRMLYKVLWQKFTVIVRGREAPSQTAMPRTAGQDGSTEKGC